jgi:hypothetical protein
MDMDIDLIYLWVNGNDPEWKHRKNVFLGLETAGDDTNCEGRFADNDELKYSLRSVEKYAHWIRKIFIVTDGQRPEWLDVSSPKIQIINQNDLLPQEAKPCYNSVVIEYFLYKIPGLAEHFLYGNDDMFLNAPLEPRFFFADDGFPYIRLRRKPFGNLRYRWKEWIGRELSTYRATVLLASRLVERQYGKFYSGTPHHNMDAYLKSDCQAVVEAVFGPEIARCTVHHKRMADDIQRALFLYYALAIRHGHLKYVGSGQSCTIDLNRGNYERRLNRHRPKLFCLNDNQHVTADDRRRVLPFLERHFPEKSSFEIEPVS